MAGLDRGRQQFISRVDDARAHLQGLVDSAYGMFVDAIARKAFRPGRIATSLAGVRVHDFLTAGAPGGKCASSRGPNMRIEEHGIHGFCGAYFAVVEPGTVTASEPCRIEPGPREVGIRELFRARLGL